MGVGALGSTGTVRESFPHSLFQPLFFFGVFFISFLNRLKVRGFLVTNGTSQLILAAELRRRHNAQLQADPLAVWEQSVALSQPGLSQALETPPSPFPTSPGFLCLLVTTGTVSGYQD